MSRDYSESSLSHLNFTILFLYSRTERVFSHISREPGFHAVVRTTEELGFGSLKEQDMFLLSIALKTSCGAHPAFYTAGTRVCFPVGEATKERSSPLPHTSSWRAA
jgi:hypothetical protein